MKRENGTCGKVGRFQILLLTLQARFYSKKIFTTGETFQKKTDWIYIPLQWFFFTVITKNEAKKRCTHTK